LMPVFAKDILYGGPDTLGFLMGAAGLGALVGAAYLLWKKNFVDLGYTIPIGAGIFGAGLIAFSMSNLLPLSLALIMVANIGFMMQTTTSNTHLQHLGADDKRGRVMAVFMMAFMGTVPIGSLLEGAMAEAIGTPNTLMIGGVFCILGALVFARKLKTLNEIVRPIYVGKGVGTKS
jgi:predicted MFS family arabinose efflux permease